MQETLQETLLKRKGQDTTGTIPSFALPPCWKWSTSRFSMQIVGFAVWCCRFYPPNQWHWQEHLSLLASTNPPPIDANANLSLFPAGSGTQPPCNLEPHVKHPKDAPKHSHQILTNFCAPFFKEIPFFLCGVTPSKSLATPRPLNIAFPLGNGGVLRSEEGGIQEGRGRWGGGKKKEKRTRKKCSEYVPNSVSKFRLLGNQCAQLKTTRACHAQDSMDTRWRTTIHNESGEWWTNRRPTKATHHMSRHDMQIHFFWLHDILLYSKWETDFYTPPVLGGAALLPFSAPAVYKNQGP